MNGSKRSRLVVGLLAVVLFSWQAAEKFNFSHGFTRMHTDKCFDFNLCPSVSIRGRPFFRNLLVLLR